MSAHRSVHRTTHSRTVLTRRIIEALLVSCLSLPLAHAATPVATQSCGEQLVGKVTRIENATYRLAFSSTPSPIVMGTHFSLAIAVCPLAGNPVANTLRVDAIMPAHQHGMNYAPSLRQIGPGLYRADGLMFHMPGLWEFRFELRGKQSSKPERLSYQLTLD